MQIERSVYISVSVILKNDPYMSDVKFLGSEVSYYGNSL
jgi:hypothetical protein